MVRFARSSSTMRRAPWFVAVARPFFLSCPLICPTPSVLPQSGESPLAGGGAEPEKVGARSAPGAHTLPPPGQASPRREAAGRLSAEPSVLPSAAHGLPVGFSVNGAASPGWDMAKNLYVGNLTFQTTADDLRALFEPYGEVIRAQVTTDRETGRSRGFGFVEMASGGGEAIADLNGKEVGGRNLTVSEAKPREDRPRGGGGYGGGRSGGGGDGGGRGGRDRY